MKPSHRNILIIAGTGRNSGKTTLALKIIKKFASQQDLVAVKISPHFHKGSHNIEPIESNRNFNLFRELNPDGGKDSALMLGAGAKKVYYIEVHDLHLQAAFDALIGRIPPSFPVVCESPALAMVITPGVHFIVDHPQTIYKKVDVLARSREADKFINTAEENMEQLVSNLSFEEEGWHFQP